MSILFALLFLGQCPEIQGKIVYLPAGVDVRTLLGMGVKGVVTEDSPVFERLKVDSYQPCRDDQCQIELGKAVSASHYVAIKDKEIWVYDLKTEAIVCAFEREIKPIVEEPEDVEGFSGYEIKPLDIPLDREEPYIPDPITDETRDPGLTIAGHALFWGGMAPIGVGIIMVLDTPDTNETALATAGIVVGAVAIVTGITCWFLRD